jgi:hypothetical protein
MLFEAAEVVDEWSHEAALRRNSYSNSCWLEGLIKEEIKYKSSINIKESKEDKMTAVVSTN